MLELNVKKILHGVEFFFRAREIKDIMIRDRLREVGKIVVYILLDLTLL